MTNLACQKAETSLCQWLVKATVFPVVIYRYESWTIKKAKQQRIDVFELQCWWRLLRVLCTAKRSNQSILKEISPEYSLEGLMLKLRLQYFGHLMENADWLKKDPNAGKDWRQKEKRAASPTQWTWMLSKLREIVEDREASCAAVHEVANSRTQLSKWTTRKFI